MAPDFQSPRGGVIAEGKVILAGAGNGFRDEVIGRTGFPEQRNEPFIFAFVRKSGFPSFVGFCGVNVAVEEIIAKNQSQETDFAFGEFVLLGDVFFDFLDQKAEEEMVTKLAANKPSDEGAQRTNGDVFLKFVFKRVIKGDAVIEDGGEDFK